MLAQNDRALAALGHAAILLPGLGMLAPVMLWCLLRERSFNMRFQLLQAAAVQAVLPVMALLAGLLSLILTLLVSLVVGLIIRAQGGGSEAILGLLAVMRVVALALALLLAGAFILAALIAAAACLLGREFRYPWLGNWLSRYLKNDDGSGEEHWLAAVCHLGAFHGLSGLAAAALAGLLQRNRSEPLHFQCLQAAAYQGAGVVVSLITGGLVFALALLSAGGLALTGGEFSGLSGLFSALAAFFSLLCLGTWLLFLPLYQTLPLVAAYRLVQKRNYVYPLLGRQVRQWIRNSQAQSD